MPSFLRKFGEALRCFLSEPTIRALSRLPRVPEAARGRSFYAQSPDKHVFPRQFVCSWITRGNINQLLIVNDCTGEVDLRSPDVDGVAIDAIMPRVVVGEFQDILGPDRSWTVPYDDNFSSTSYPTTRGMPNFAGASLAAFVKLGEKKEYRLVGTNRLWYNAFFVGNGLSEQLLPAIGARQCFDHPKVLWGMKEQFPTVQHLPWVEV